MPRSGEDILADLELAFGEPSIANSVQTSDGKIVRLHKTLWNDSPLLQARSAGINSYVVTSFSYEKLMELIKVHTSKQFPSDLPELCSLVETCSKLGLENFTAECADVLFKRTEFLKVDYPREWSSEVVMHCLKVLLDSPLRTADAYKEELTRLATHCNNDRDIMANAMNLIKKKIKEYSVINLQGIPMNFERRTLPIAIYNRTGKRQTAIFDGKSFTNVDLFGKNFNLNESELSLEDSFYVKYGSYILFKSGASVYRKNLRDDSVPEKILENCSLLLTRREFVFAVDSKEGKHTLLQWIKDEKFVGVYQSDQRILSIDFECDEGSLVIAHEERSILAFKWSEDANLTFLAEEIMPDLHGIVMSRNNLVFVLKDPSDDTDSDKSLLTTYDISKGTFELVCSTMVNRVFVKKAGRNFFDASGGSLKIIEDFPSMDVMRKISTVYDSPVLSELCM